MHCAALRAALVVCKKHWKDKVTTALQRAKRLNGCEPPWPPYWAIGLHNAAQGGRIRKLHDAAQARSFRKLSVSLKGNSVFQRAPRPPLTP